MENNECCTCAMSRTTERDAKLKDTLITRLNRIEGQIRGIKGMVERDAYCDDILNQIAAARAAMDSLSKLVLENHMRGCLIKKVRDGDDGIVDELLTTIGKLLK
ncbi:MAG TPA: metal-sensitive transcriptional regulator [Bacillota bacterium]|nr:metal-sensitive transcriptional regulator [Bacillota bacterium]HOK68526.1 metal-sensitive transcriptional regulator [Bacillota bacterium]HPP86173.1 metal-sensitive transcriptional regulator [Bacillota bacterium]